jgi:Flp pilus assembly protein TadB
VGSYTSPTAYRYGRSAIITGRVGVLDMAASSTPGPDDPGGLSPSERKILAGIENDIHTTDPSLSRRLTDAYRGGTRLRALARHGALLVAALVVLMVAAAVLPTHLMGLLALLTTLLLVPWILLFPTDRSHRK